MRGKYWGSVRFFKHVILTSIVLAIIIPVVCSIVYSQKCRILLRDVSAFKQQLQQIKNSPGANGSASEKPVMPNSPQTWTEDLSYQLLYTELYVRKTQKNIHEKGVMYLTFDDGPSVECTGKVLDILAENGIKATFFVVGRNSDTEKKRQLLKRIVDEGHTIGIHSYSHDYKQIYASVEAFLEDFNKIYHWVYKTTGIKPEIFRFPGGSVNNYNANTRREIITEMTRRGFRYFDWNVAAMDAVENGISAEKIESNILDHAKNVTRGVVLMHDSTRMNSTVEALPSIIAGLKEQGFIFKPLTREVLPIKFEYN